MAAESAAVADPLGSAPFDAFFLDGSAGRLFCVYRPGAPSSRSAATPPAVLVVPAFAEEMNKSRRMLSLFAQRAQAAGIGTLIVDLYGSGDSEGDFGEATLATWTDDLHRASTWLADHAAVGVSVLAIRAGALLLDRLPEALDRQRLVLWQPVTSGRVFVNQLLRLKLAGGMLAGEGQVDSAALRKELDRAGRLEVAGYEISAQLFGDLEALELMQTDVSRYAAIHAFEVGATAGAVSPALERVLRAWRCEGRELTATAIAGDPFWGTVEIATVPALLDATVEAFRVGVPG